MDHIELNALREAVSRDLEGSSGRLKRSAAAIIKALNEFLKETDRADNIIPDTHVGNAARELRRFVDSGSYGSIVSVELLNELYIHEGIVGIVDKVDKKDDRNWIAAIVNIIPRLHNMIQLTGLAVAVAAIVATQLVTPGNIPAIIAAGSLGVTIIIFAQAFHFLPVIPESQRATLIVLLFGLFLVFEVVIANILRIELENSVSVKRLADLSQLSCDNGNKRDVLYIDDTYSLKRNVGSYNATAQTVGKMDVHLYDENVAGSPKITPDIRESGDDVKYFTWPVTITDGIAHVKYEWIGSESDEHNEGVNFISSYTITDIDAKIILPHGTKLTNIRKSPAECSVRNKDGEPDVYYFFCEKINTHAGAELVWDWDLWKIALETAPAWLSPVGRRRTP